MGQGDALTFALHRTHMVPTAPAFHPGHGRLLAFAWLVCIATPASAQLPPAVEAAMVRSALPRDAVTLLVVDAHGGAAARLSHRAAQPVNPASIMKLVTTYAALDLLGPAYTWSTAVLTDGAVQAGTLAGNLYLHGQGDPKLVVERLWLLLRRVQALGIRRISGDIVLDRSAFESVEVDPSVFDGEPLRPYNVAPDALLINFKSLLLSFTPQRSSNEVLISYEPPLAGVQVQTRAALAAGECTDYRAALKADFLDPNRIRFAGSYPASCAEKIWPVAYADPRSYGARAVEGLWREMGGMLDGSVREGLVPAAAAPGAATGRRTLFEFSSPALAEVIRDVNKFSNNVMAQQLFLTLSLPGRGQNGTTGNGPPATLEASREVLRRWWQNRFGGNDMPVLDNGSGLSRQQRISAQALARMLQHAHASPLMPDLMASLPITGVDGTLRSQRAMAMGAAHLKTGSLRDVTGVAGFVHAASGKRYVLVAIANHDNANAFRPVVSALIDWAAKDRNTKDN